MSSFFTDNPPPTVPSTTPTPQQGAPPAAQGQPPQGDPKQIALSYAQSLGPPSPENIQKTADYMKSLGYNVQANHGSDGFFLNGVGVDMVSNFHGQGPSNWQWLPDGPGAGGGNPNDPPGFQTGTFTGGGQYPLASVMGTGLSQPWTTPFNAPDPNSFTNDKPLQWQMEQGTNAVTRGLAKNGTLLTGGAAKALDRYGQGVASQYYNDAYNRAIQQYQQAYGVFSNNQGNLFNRLSALGSVGENAAAGTGSLYQDVGNAQATGANSQGNIAANTATGLGNTAAELWYLNQQKNNPTGGPGRGPNSDPLI